MSGREPLAREQTTSLSPPTLDDLVATWDGRRNQVLGDARGAFLRAVVDRIADGLPATPTSIAERTGQGLETVARQLEAVAAAGFEVRDGAVVGAALTLVPTRHEFMVRGNTLHTWCGFDALFLPLLLGETADVRSSCPQTGEPIELSVEPDGSVHHVTPSTTVVAIMGGEAATCSTAGPTSELCTQMPFLASADAGRAWQTGRDGVAVVDLPTAMVVARAYVDQAAPPGVPLHPTAD